MSNAALKIVPPQPFTDAEIGNAEDFLGEVWKIGAAYDAQIGGQGSLHIRRGRDGYIASWGDRIGSLECGGSCIVDAVMALVAKMAGHLRDWTLDDGADLSPALSASLALLRLDRAVSS